MGLRRSIAGLAIEGFAIFKTDDLEARWNGFHVKIIGSLFRP
jgi:hypothetical protein